jgi:hypothetical protein
VFPALGQGEELLAAAGMQAQTDGSFVEFRNRVVSTSGAALGRSISRPVNRVGCEASRPIHDAVIVNEMLRAFKRIVSY